MPDIRVYPIPRELVFLRGRPGEYHLEIWKGPRLTIGFGAPHLLTDVYEDWREALAVGSEIAKLRMAPLMLVPGNMP